MHTEREFCPHLLVDIRKMVEPPYGGRESSDELSGRSPEEGDVKHILRSPFTSPRNCHDGADAEYI